MVADGAVMDVATSVSLKPFTRDVQFDYTALSLV
jgi:hypothetical protein